MEARRNFTQLYNKMTLNEIIKMTPKVSVHNLTFPRVSRLFLLFFTVSSSSCIHLKYHATLLVTFAYFFILATLLLLCNSFLPLFNSFHAILLHIFSSFRSRCRFISTFLGHSLLPLFFALAIRLLLSSARLVSLYFRQIDWNGLMEVIFDEKIADREEFVVKAPSYLPVVEKLILETSPR